MANINKIQQLLLIFTLVAILVGMTGHIAPANLTCCCTSERVNKVSSNLNVKTETDSCLICLLSSGVYSQNINGCLETGDVSINNNLALNPVDHTEEITHPPNLI